MKLNELDLASASDALAKGQVSSMDLTNALLMKAASSRTNAFLRIDHELARARAREMDVERASGLYRGPLHGIPMAHKDMFHRVGVESSYGAALRLPLPSEDATVLRRLDEAGTVSIGVLNMSAFAVGPTGHNISKGHCRNPWGLDRITGGSSSGSAAAVAERASFASLGSDTAGSIRLPAAMCGVTGLKPTYGRVSRRGAMAFAFSLDAVGPIARTAKDCAMLMDAIAGADPADPTCSPRAGSQYVKSIADWSRGLRVGVPQNFFCEGLQPGVSNALKQSLEQLASMGCEIVPIQVPDLAIEDAATAVVIACEGLVQHQRWMREQPEAYGAQLRIRLERGAVIPAPVYLGALRQRARSLEQMMDAVFTKVDVLHCPVTPMTAPTLDSTDMDRGANVDDIVGSLTRFTRPWNYLGLPALAVPIGVDEHALPIGMQLIGRPFSEEVLLRVGHAYQSETSWHLQTPPPA